MPDRPASPNWPCLLLLAAIMALTIGVVVSLVN
jgi:hypothetical protein